MKSEERVVNSKDVTQRMTRQRNKEIKEDK